MYPDYCIGWLYVTTPRSARQLLSKPQKNLLAWTCSKHYFPLIHSVLPCVRVGLALVQVSVLLHSHLVVTNDDNFVTGILRERLQPEVEATWQEQHRLMLARAQGGGGPKRRGGGGGEDGRYWRRCRLRF